MSEDLLQQIITILKNAKSVVIVLSSEPTMDSIASSYALEAAIKKMGGAAVIASASKSISPIPFLQNTPTIATSLASDSGQIAIKISNAHAQPGELRYEMEPDGLVVYLKSKEGQFDAADVTVLPATPKFDAIITLGVSGFDQMGELYTANSAVFFETPIVNIDINPGNEYFGTVNMVNVKVSSVSEALMDLIESMPDSMTDDTVITGLLTGIIDQTHSFRDPKTTPVTLSKAAQLVTAGARQQDIIQHLFKTKPFTTLQLWGRALARLVSVPESSLLYTAVTKSDLEKTSTDPLVLTEVLRDLVEMVSDFAIISLAAEMPEGVKLFIAGLPHIKVGELLQKLGVASSPVHHLVGNYEFASATISGKSLADIQVALTESVQA